jgi:hypothetical protein
MESSGKGKGPRARSPRPARAACETPAGHPQERLYAQMGYEFGRTYPHTRHHGALGQHILTAGLGWQF